MTNIGILFLIAILAFSIYLYRVLKKSNLQIKNVPDFLSYGTDISESSLERTFEGSNASFLTAFVSLFFYVFFLGINTIWIPIGFLIGIILFNYIFLPRLIDSFKNDYRLPEFITSDFPRHWVRVIVGLFAILNLYLFTYTEIQGFHLFLASFFTGNNFLVIAIPFLIILIIALYTTFGGYRAIILTDKVQVWLIRIGAICLLIFILISFTKYGVEIPKEIKTIDVNFLIATIFGFLLSQLMYYDNWQRLSFYTVQKSKIENWKEDEVPNKLNEIVKTIRKNYNIGAIILLFLYLLPIGLGFLFFSKQPDFEFANFSAPALLASFLQSTIQIDFSLLGIFNIIFIVVLSLFFFGALVTTTDTYILGSINILVEDIFKLFSREDRYNVSNGKQLEIIRLLTLVFALSFLMFIFIEPYFEKIYLFMFYSVNGLAGPLLWRTFKRKLNIYTFFFSIIFCFVYAYLKIYKGFSPANYIDLKATFLFDAGFVTMFASILISLIGTQKIKS